MGGLVRGLMNTLSVPPAYPGITQGALASWDPWGLSLVAGEARSLPKGESFVVGSVERLGGKKPGAFAREASVEMERNLGAELW